jgi:hypothetical protein
MKKDSNSAAKSEQSGKPVKKQSRVQCETQQVMNELLAKLSRKLNATASSPAENKGGEAAVAPNQNRLTVGVDLGDQSSNYCIVGLEGETLNEGQIRTRQQEIAEFFGGIAKSRVIIEVGTHSA